MTTASAAADDSYQPAITMPTEPEAGEQTAAAAPAETPPARPASPSRTAEAQAQAGDDAPAEDTARGPRQISPKVRAMFKDIAKRAAETGEIGGADDLVPMGTDSPTAAAAPVAAGAAQASPIGTSGQAAAAAAPPLPTLRLPNPPPQTPRADDAAQSAAAQARAAEIERREQALAARESELSAREKLLPSRDRLAEAPADTLIGWLKETFGADDNEVTLLAGSGERPVAKAPKEEVAAAILDEVETLIGHG